jgi:hypothetical protein
VSMNGAGDAGASSASGVGASRRAPRGVVWHGRRRQDVTQTKDARGSGLRRSGDGGCCSGTGTQSSGRRRRGRARKGDGRQSGAPPQIEHARRRPTDWKGGRELARSWDARGVASRKEKRRSEGGGYSTANSEGAAAQRQGGQGRSNAAQVRRATQDRRQL